MIEEHKKTMFVRYFCFVFLFIIMITLIGLSFNKYQELSKMVKQDKTELVSKNSNLAKQIKNQNVLIDNFNKELIKSNQNISDLSNQLKTLK